MQVSDLRRLESPILRVQRHVLSDGAEVSLPIRYIDCRCLAATFLTSMERAAPVMEGTGLHAVPQEDGKAAVLILFFEYRQTDIGPYNEVGVCVLSAAPHDPVPGIYVVDLPVTTEAAWRAGRELWGYNKFVTGITVEGKGKQFTTTVSDPDDRTQTICTFGGDRGASVLTPPFDLFSFSLLETTIVKTHVQIPVPWHSGGGNDFQLRVGDSDHRMAANLRTLGLGDARPIVVQYADPFQSLLFPGQAV